MTENLKENTGKTVDSGHTATTAGKVNPWNKNKDSGKTVPTASVHEKPLLHKGVSADPKFKDHNMHKDAEMTNVPEKTGIHKDVSADLKSKDHTSYKNEEMTTVPEKTGIHKDVSADPKSKDHHMHKNEEMKTGHEMTGVHKDVPHDAQVTADVRNRVYTQISAALAGATFPVKNHADLLSAFPDGKVNTYHIGDLWMTAGEAGKLLKDTDFPFASAKAVADVIVERASL
ncbi:MAG: MTH865 family protein [Methanoregula sp.]|nr:MTH865 family protein [Methanoregula sp.]